MICRVEERPKKQFLKAWFPKHFERQSSVAPSFSYPTWRRPHATCQKWWVTAKMKNSDFNFSERRFTHFFLMGNRRQLRSCHASLLNLFIELSRAHDYNACLVYLEIVLESRSKEAKFDSLCLRSTEEDELPLAPLVKKHSLSDFPVLVDKLQQLQGIWPWPSAGAPTV